MDQRYAILDPTTGTVVNVALFTVPDGGTMHDSGGGQYWIRDAAGAFVASYAVATGHTLVALADAAFCEPGARQQPDGTFVAPAAP